MSYGAAAINGSGELTFASDGLLPGYIGRAAHVSTQQAGASAINAFAGYSTYTIAWSGRIVVALPLQVGKPTALRSVSQSGGTWTITVHQGTGAQDSRGFDIQEATEVYVFGVPTSATGYGAALFDSAGQLVGDLSRRPLTISQCVNLADSAMTAALTGLTAPAFVGAEPSLIHTNEFIGGGTWVNKIVNGAWMRESSAVITRANMLGTRYQDDGPLAAMSTRPAISVLVIEASVLT